LPDRTGVVAGYADHPLPRLLAPGVRVTVNSDDPTFFGASLLDESPRCVETFGLSLARLAINAAEAAFLALPARAGLVERVRRDWAALG
jgi:adenosine deaminase